MEERFIDLGIAYIDTEAIIGLATVDIPATPVANELYAVNIYIPTHVICVPYTTQEERDKVYADLKARCR